ncbi:MAG: hydrogen peroxide-inducible genes activator [Bacteroidetes bacterium]|nr:hydrogen peroxide-inducible genes activator [Bacteroidota bacterium]
MTIQQLEYVIALDNHRNFVRAAESCFVTQPTLTMQVQKLEDEIGFQIFNRTRKPLQPTRQGVEFIDGARRIIKEYRLLKSKITQEKEEVSGMYRIGIIPTLAPYLIHRFLPHFIRYLPDTRLIISEMQSEHIISAIKKDTIDIGIMATPINEDQIREIPVYYEPFLAYLPAGHPLLEKEILDQNELGIDGLLLMEEGHCFRNQALNICSATKRNDEMSFEYQSGSIGSLLRLVEEGAGYTLLPELSLEHEIVNKDNIRRFIHPEPSREIGIVVHSTFSRDGLIMELKNTISGNIPESFRKDESFIRIKWR